MVHPILFIAIITTTRIVQIIKKREVKFDTISRVQPQPESKQAVQVTKNEGKPPGC